MQYVDPNTDIDRIASALALAVALAGALVALL